jgi:AraC-like DNA-binding protein
MKNVTYENIRYDSDNFKIIIKSCTTRQYEDAFHEALEIKYFYEGRAIVMIGSEMIVAEQGDIVVINPFEVHSSITSDDYMGKYYSFMVDLDFFAENGIYDFDLRQELLVNGKRFNHHIKNNQRLKAIILRVKDEIDKKEEHYKIIAKSIICEFFALLFRDELYIELSEDINKVSIKRGIDILPALQKIFREYQNHLTVDELAQLCNISKYHFCRIFKQHMGVTVVQYIINYRLSIAELMLNSKNYSIGEIASMCGFDDISYFYRCYKRVKGVSPNKTRS